MHQPRRLTGAARVLGRQRSVLGRPTGVRRRLGRKSLDRWHLEQRSSERHYRIGRHRQPDQRRLGRGKWLGCDRHERERRLGNLERRHRHFRGTAGTGSSGGGETSGGSGGTQGGTAGSEAGGTGGSTTVDPVAPSRRLPGARGGRLHRGDGGRRLRVRTRIEQRSRATARQDRGRRRRALPARDFPGQQVRPHERWVQFKVALRGKLRRALLVVSGSLRRNLPVREGRQAAGPRRGHGSHRLLQRRRRLLGARHVAQPGPRGRVRQLRRKGGSLRGRVRPRARRRPRSRPSAGPGSRSSTTC